MIFAAVATAFALQGGVTPPSQRASGAAKPVLPDSIVLLNSIVSAEQKFFGQWRAAWIASEQSRGRRGEGGPWFDPSKADLSCNADPAIYVPDNARRAKRPARVNRAPRYATNGMDQMNQPG